MENRIVTVTGHRPKYFKNGYSLETSKLLYNIFYNWLSVNTIDALVSGAALGVDIEAIQAAVDLNIPFYPLETRMLNGSLKIRKSIENY